MRYSKEVRDMIKEAYGTRSDLFAMLSAGNVRLSFVLKARIKDPKKVHGEAWKQNEFLIKLYKRCKAEEQEWINKKKAVKNGGREI